MVYLLFVDLFVCFLDGEIGVANIPTEKPAMAESRYTADSSSPVMIKTEPQALVISNRDSNPRLSESFLTWVGFLPNFAIATISPLLCVI